VNARVEASVGGEIRTLKNEVEDPVKPLWSPGEHAHARVGMTVGTQYDFGRIKIAATVSYECDQKQALIDEAGALAFYKAMEFMNEGLAILQEEAGQ